MRTTRMFGCLLTAAIPAAAHAVGACCFIDDGQLSCVITSPTTCEETLDGRHLGGSSSCATDCDERAHPGWNSVSFELTLTKNQPTYWSALNGSPSGAPPFTVLDPGDPPGRIDPQSDDGDRVLRGYLVGWAVNSNNEEIRWNHLKGDAILIDFSEPSAWEYNAWAFPVVADVAQGEQSGDPGVLNLDGVEYAPGFDVLILDFYAWQSSPFSYPGISGNGGPYVYTDLTLHPLDVDLRQEDDGPVTTKAKIDVWNEYEVKFNGMERCITCWDQTLLEDYAAFGIPNNFLYTTLGTNKGKARIDGVQSDNCDFDFEFDPFVPFGADPRDIVSQDASLLGVAAKCIDFEGSDAAAGMNIHGAGTQSGVIRYDPLGASPEAAGPAARRDLSISSAARSRRPQIGAAEGVPSSVDRVSSTEKGSLLMFSKIQIRWDEHVELEQDTFVDVTNDFGEDVMVQFYLINGDAPIGPIEAVEVVP